MDIEAQPFDLRECVESALDLVSARATEKHLDIAYVFEGDVPAAIRGDVTRLRQIMLNLLSNAVKFTEHGEVVVTVTAKPRADSAPSSRSPCATRASASRRRAMSRLFQSFTQADSSTTRKYGGTGLGLAISKRLAELMGGHMWGESEGPGKGSTFYFSIKVPAAASAPCPLARFRRRAARAARQARARRRRQRDEPARARAADRQVGHAVRSPPNRRRKRCAGSPRARRSTSRFSTCTCRKWTA